MVVRQFLDWFWNPDVWLPPGFDWKDIVPTEEVKYAVPYDLLYAIPIGIGMVFVRYFLERTLFYPLGHLLGIKEQKKLRILPANPTLEKAFTGKGKKAKLFTHKELEELGKKTDLQVRQVERWMRRRAAQGKPTTLAKFSESCWRFLCYLISFLIGVYVLWDKPWLWDILHCWYDYPHHSVTTDIWWYYVYGSSFYWSLLITLAYDAKRKDFWEMSLHHVATLCLLAFSWTCNLTRVGTLVLLLHDFVEPWLEGSKLCKYSKHNGIGDVVSIMFILAWIATRITLFPMHIINSTLFEAPKIIPMFSAYYIFNGMLILLFCLHVFWTYFIAIYVYNALSMNATELKDTRSSSEYVTEPSEEEEGSEFDGKHSGRSTPKGGITRRGLFYEKKQFT
ncbi:ceramide synthase 6 [Folsomia candida]|uniref:Ceramide synthase 6 n=1 Tax=Folsomia candida TaxID=158441 RepID=A0A226DRG6_FOLCA|nr:ceramide synthase 6 [Folsomia candida]OXA47434.1 Ceramide synthase 6 [Folsomia candida]